MVFWKSSVLIGRDIWYYPLTPSFCEINPILSHICLCIRYIRGFAISHICAGNKYVLWQTFIRVHMVLFTNNGVLEKLCSDWPRHLVLSPANPDSSHCWRDFRERKDRPAAALVYHREFQVMAHTKWDHIMQLIVQYLDIIVCNALII